MDSSRTIPLLCALTAASCAGAMPSPSDPGEVEFAPDLGIDPAAPARLTGGPSCSDVRQGDSWSDFERIREVRCGPVASV